jgi:putative transposase
MPRLARIAPKECVYHILTRGNNRQDVFKDNRDYQKYMEILQRYKEQYKFKLYHYVLMRNHVHLVLETTDKSGSLSEIMKGINLSYVQYYKIRYKHLGHFWQDRYKSILISKDDYLLACGSYVELNPVRARIVKDPKDYMWSSYNSYAHGIGDKITDDHPIYRSIASEERDRRNGYREFVKGMIREKKAMKGEMEKRIVYGSESFLEKALKVYKVDAVVRPQGRPKKAKNDKK